MSCSARNVVKYLLFALNFIFWLIGVTLIGVGVWAYYEKNKFYHSLPESIYYIIVDVSIVMVFIGLVIFFITFAGCLGALRENTCLIKIFAYCLAVVFLIELVCALLAIIFSSEVKQIVTEVVQDKCLLRYREDAYLQSLMDWIQETFGCCGVGTNGYLDWSQNMYFNCIDENPSVERCAVPYSCCINPDNLQENIENTACGYHVQMLPKFEAAQLIYTDGCVEEILDAMPINLLIVGGVGIGIAVLQENIENTACGYHVQMLPKFEAAQLIYTDGCVEEILDAMPINLLIVGGVGIGIAVLQLSTMFLAIFLQRECADQANRRRLSAEHHERRWSQQAVLHPSRYKGHTNRGASIPE